MENQPHINAARPPRAGHPNKHTRAKLNTTVIIMGVAMVAAPHIAHPIGMIEQNLTMTLDNNGAHASDKWEAGPGIGHKGGFENRRYMSLNQYLDATRNDYWIHNTSNIDYPVLIETGVPGIDTDMYTGYVQSGTYTPHLYVCPGTICTPETSYTSIAGDSFQVPSHVNLKDIHYVINFTRNKNNFPISANATISVCVGLRNDTTGVVYAITSGLGCGADTSPIPPGQCTVNTESQDLSVPLGTITRSQIPINPDVNAGTAKNVVINCTGDDPVTASYSITAMTPVTYNDKSLIGTSLPGLGVATSVGEQPVMTNTEYPISLQPGDNTLALKFQAVRDPAVQPNKLPTGDFSADAVMTITQQ